MSSGRRVCRCARYARRSKARPIHSL
jgi:hypothetical protein